jgi:carboxylesterase type B
LSTAGPEAPGNYGLLDIIAALKWVNEYIEHFGGNKNNLTFGGFSTGGASVHLLMTSPLAKGIPTSVLSRVMPFICIEIDFC